MRDDVPVVGATASSPSVPAEPPLTPSEQAKRALFSIIQLRVQIDQSPIHPIIMRWQIDLTEALVESVVDVLVAKGVATQAEFDEAYTARLMKMTEMVKDSIKTARDNQTRVEVAKIVPGARGRG